MAQYLHMTAALRWLRCSAGVEVVVLGVLLQQLHGVLHPGHAGLLLAAGPGLRPGPVLAGQGHRVPAVESLAGVGRVAGVAVLAGQRHRVPVPGPRAPHTARRRRAPRVAGVAGAVARVVTVTTVPRVVTTLETRRMVTTVPGVVRLTVPGVV